VAELTVRRWTRYGKDRLYVNDADGSRVGWLDLETDEVVLEREVLREEFERALALHRAKQGSEATPQPPGSIDSSSDAPQASVGDAAPNVPSPVASSPPAARVPSAADRYESDRPGDEWSNQGPIEPFAVTIGWHDLSSRDSPDRRSIAFGPPGEVAGAVEDAACRPGRGVRIRHRPRRHRAERRLHCQRQAPS
jgi:hypothetical protein